ncbi:MAG: DUF5103 domain-containing protein [Bacteroidetes bacterium]|nr:DUF5103 domain-containing protein [Bacteroidota bacterium]
MYKLKALLFCSALLLISGQNLEGQTDRYYDGGPLKYDDHIYQAGIRTVRLVPVGNDLAMPVIALNSGAILELSFDDLYEEFTNLSYSIYHCNADWTPSDLMRNDYLTNFSDDYIQDFEYSINAFIPYTHYRLSIPNNNVGLKISGNYVIAVYRDNDPNDLVLSRRFMVYEEIVNVGGRVKRPTRVEKIDTHQELDFTISHGSYPIPNPFTDLKVTLLKNQRWDMAITDLKPQFLQNGQLIYQYDDENTFESFNEWRNFDIKNLLSLSLNVRQIRQDTFFKVYLRKDPSRAVERYSTQFDINGQNRVRRLDAANSDSEADYALVDFYLDYPNKIESDVYLFGEFSDWKMRDEYKLYWDEQRKAYRCQSLLKQGFYNYAFAVNQSGKDYADLSFFEGSHWQTENDYQILVYNREIGSRYDRLVGFATFNSDDLFNRND